MEVRFCWWLRLWKSISRAALKPPSKRLVQTRRRSRIAGWNDAWEKIRTRDVRVELPVPQENVQALDLVDQEQDRSACRCNLRAWVVLQSPTPSSQDVQLLRVESMVVHAARLSPPRVRVWISAAEDPEGRCGFRAPPHHRGAESAADTG